MLRVVLLCRAAFPSSSSLSFRSASSIPVPQALLVPGYPGHHESVSFRVQLLRSGYFGFQAFAFGFGNQFCRSHPPPPTPAKTRILTSRAACQQANLLARGAKPHLLIYGFRQSVQAFQLLQRLIFHCRLNRTGACASYLKQIVTRASVSSFEVCAKVAPGPLLRAPLSGLTSPGSTT